jgi:4-hydroxy-3-polyprenylbenzoate decarboxylase
MSFCKGLVLVDSQVDLSSPRIVLETLLNQVDLESDLYISEGVLDVLDHSAPEPLFGAKVGVDATSRLPNEKNRRGPSEPLPIPSRELTEQSLREISPFLVAFHVPQLNVRNRLLLLNFLKDGSLSGCDLAHKLLSHPVLKAFYILLLHDAPLDLTDASLVLWKVFNNVDPKRDIIRRDNRVVMDATKKGPEDGHLRAWPDDIVMDPAIVEKVQLRSEELGIQQFLRPCEGREDQPGKGLTNRSSSRA